MENKTLEIVTFFRTVQEVRKALRGEEAVSDERLRTWSQVAHWARDGWLYAQLAQLLVRHRPHDLTWAPVVMGWLLEAAQRKSLWTEQLVYWALRGWPAALLHSAVALMCIQFHPRGFAEGLWKAVQAGILSPAAIPAAWLESLLPFSVNGPAGDRAVVRQVLEAIRRLERRAHTPTLPSGIGDREEPGVLSERSPETHFQVDAAAG